MVMTRQMKQWSGVFGRNYTKRNALSRQEFDRRHRERYSKSRIEMNIEFIGQLDRSLKILEVGCNRGDQLRCLQEMGFTSLFGIDVQSYALQDAKQATHGIEYVGASSFELPYRDRSFDLVFTSGLLIHISPRDIAMAMGEICRCSKQYIWGLEYYHETRAECIYRNKTEMLWKGNYARMYGELFEDLSLVKETLFHCRNSDDVDSMFLLERSI